VLVVAKSTASSGSTSFTVIAGREIFFKSHAASDTRRCVKFRIGQQSKPSDLDGAVGTQSSDLELAHETLLNNGAALGGAARVTR